MTRPQKSRRSARRPLRRATDPLVPAVLLTGGALLAATQGHVLTWAMIGGLAGYTLSGSVWTRNSAYVLASPGWRDRDRQGIVLTLFVVGLLAGGLLSGLVLGLLSGLAQPLPLNWRHAAIVALALLGLLRDLGVVRIRLPQNARQVPQEVLRSDLRRGALQFGFELGTGVRTYVSASVPYVLALAVFLGGQRLWVAALAGLGFGAGRAVTPLVRRASGSVDGWDADLRVRLRAIAVLGCAAAAAAFGLLFLHGL